MKKPPIRVIVDSREQCPYEFLDEKDIVATVLGLKTGDYALQDFPGKTCIERKSLGDFVNCITHDRTRFWAELERMKDIPYRAVVVESNYIDVEIGNYVSRAAPKSVLASALAISCDFGIQVIWAGGRASSEWSVAWLLRRWHGRLVEQNSNTAA